MSLISQTIRALLFLPIFKIIFWQARRASFIIEEVKIIAQFNQGRTTVMVRNILITLVLVLICVPSWQIGSIMIQKKQIGHLLEEQANSIKRYDNEDIVKKNLKEQLEIMGLPSNFTFERPERWKVKIKYEYNAAASVFGHTYYEVSETLEASTEDGKFNR